MCGAVVLTDYVSGGNDPRIPNTLLDLQLRAPHTCTGSAPMSPYSVWFPSSQARGLLLGSLVEALPVARFSQVFALWLLFPPCHSLLK